MASSVSRELRHVLVTCMITRSVCFCYCRRIWSNKNRKFIIVRYFGDCPVIRSPPQDPVATIIFRSSFLTTRSSKELLASTPQLLVSIALNLTAAGPYLLFPLIWPQSACFIQLCFRQGATRLISAYVLHHARSSFPIVKPHHLILLTTLILHHTEVD